jgi:chemotaxis protein histidine kinase CheA/CheY-like chemotaxis protein
MQPEQQQRIMGYFIEEAKEHLNTIEQGLLNLQSTLSDPEMTNELFRAAHSVKGGAAMLGLNSIQRVSHRLEDFFKVLKDSPIQVDQKLESLFLQVFDALQELLTQLQSPFGLSEETANATVAGVEPSFAELEQHLNALAADRPVVAATHPVVEAAPAPVAARQESALVLLFSNDIPVRLREMLQLFKQSETDPSVRQALQSICRNFISIGEQFELPDWCSLITLASRAIANPDHSYRALAPVIIKDIKQAQELVLAGRSAEIYPCAQLQDLAPTPVVPTQNYDELDDLQLDDLQLDDLQLTDAPEFGGAAPLNLATANASESIFEEFAFVEGLETAGSPSLEAFTSGFRGDRGEEADHNGPEVGIAELNSLADLFEGEVPDLGSTWQEEEVLSDVDEPLMGQIGDAFSADDSNDFSDLFDQPSSRPVSTVDADLNDLFEDTLFEEGSSPESGAGLGLDDLGLDDLGLGNSGLDNLGLDDLGLDDSGLDDLGLDDLAASLSTPDSAAPDDLDGIFSFASSEPQAELSLDDFNSLPSAPEEADLFGDLDLDDLDDDLNSASPALSQESIDEFGDAFGLDNALESSASDSPLDELDLEGFDLDGLGELDELDALDSLDDRNPRADDRAASASLTDDLFGFESEGELDLALDSSGSENPIADDVGLDADLWQDGSLPSVNAGDSSSGDLEVLGLGFDPASDLDDLGDLGLGDLFEGDREELTDSDDLDFSALLAADSSESPNPDELSQDDLVLEDLSGELSLEDLTGDADLDLSGDWLDEPTPDLPETSASVDRALEATPPGSVPDPWDTYVPASASTPSAMEMPSTQDLADLDPPATFVVEPPAAQPDIQPDIGTDVSADLWADLDAPAEPQSHEPAPDPTSADPFSTIVQSEGMDFDLGEMFQQSDLQEPDSETIEELSLTDDFSFNFDDLGSTESEASTGLGAMEELDLNQTFYQQPEAIEELSLTDDLGMDDLNFDLGDLGVGSLEATNPSEELDLNQTFYQQPEAIEELSLTDDLGTDDLNFDLDGLGLDGLEADPQSAAAAELSLDDLDLEGVAPDTESLTLGDLDLETSSSDSDDLDFLDTFGSEPTLDLGLDSGLDLDLDSELDLGLAAEPTAPKTGDTGADDFLNFESDLTDDSNDLDLSLSEDSLDFGDDLFAADPTDRSSLPGDEADDLFAGDPLNLDSLDSAVDAATVAPAALGEADLNFEDDLFGAAAAPAADFSDFSDSLGLAQFDPLAAADLDMGEMELETLTPIEENEGLGFGANHNLLDLDGLDTDVTLMNDLDLGSFDLEGSPSHEPVSTTEGADLFDFDGLEQSSSNELNEEPSLNSDLDLGDLGDLSDLDLDLFDSDPDQGGSEVSALDSLSDASDSEVSAADLDFQADFFGSGESELSLDPIDALDSDLDLNSDLDLGLDSDLDSSVDFAASSDDFDLGAMSLFSEESGAASLENAAAIDSSLDFEDTADLAGLDQLLSEETGDTGEFDDLESMLGSSSTHNDDEDFAGLDEFLGQNLAGSDTDLVDADFSDMEQLLGADASDADAFGDLEDLLGPAALTAAAIGAAGVAAHQFAQPSGSQSPQDDFTDLDALLQGDLEPSQLANNSAADLGFDELDDLLKDAEEKLPGSPTVKASRGAAPQSRRNVRPGRGFVEQTMRVPVKHLDNLSNLVGELVVNRNSLEEDQERLRQSLDNLLYQVQQLSDVGQRMQDLYERSLLESSLLASRQGSRSPVIGVFRESQIATQTTSSTGVEYDPLEMDRFTGFHSLSQEMIELIVRVRESSSDIEFIVDETDQVTRMFRQVTTQLQEGLTRSRMVPFAQTADRLPRAVRDISMKVGKQVELQIEGRETLIDKMILEQLYDPMTHLVNNALTHGIESPEVRRAAGKSAVGRITIRAFHQGNQTIISVSDDGAGIDVDRVKAKAVEKGVLTLSEAKGMSRLDVYDLLFQAGFSTKDQADDFSGRGVGMDVVRTSLSEIRGVVNTDSTPGKGTSFTIRLPLTLSISKALCCISDRARVAFPMDGVEDMLDLPKERLQTNAEGKLCVSWRDSMLQLYPLAELLGYNRHLSRGNVYGGNQEDDITSIVVLRSAGNFLALQVDQVLGEQEIVIKQLEGPIPKPIGVAGATVLGDGRIMPIADVLELIDLSMGRIRKDSGGSLWDQGPTTPAEPPVVKTEPTVLIVDDSITVRELLSMTFNKVGYRVEQARDGQEAWEKLRSGLPCDIVFCDIEMPRMDGLELLSRIQKDSTLSHLPIAMLTSRGADRHRQMAASLGANGYFTKPYLEEALLDAAQRMLKGEVLLSPSNPPS